MPMAKNKLYFPVRYFLYIVLWGAFLGLQLALFVPLENQQNPDAALSLENSAGIQPHVARRTVTQQKQRPPGDAVFNNIDVYYRQPTIGLKSHVYCIGRDLGPNREVQANFSWMFRSCRFERLCMNTTSHEFILVSDDNKLVPEPEQELAMGAINPRWSGRGFNKGFHKVKWFPRITPSQILQHGFYELPDNVVMVPFHSMAAHNVGHLLWDDFYPLFTLLKLFGFVSTADISHRYQHLLLRWSTKEKLYATCEMQKKKGTICKANFERFLPLLGVDPSTFSTVKNAQLLPRQQQELKSPLVCSRQAVAGIGMLMDHGMKDHGWMLRDPNSGQDLIPHNLGRGGIFQEFRNFMIGNMGLPLEPIPQRRGNKITFSTHSSRGYERSLGFENQTSLLMQSLASFSFGKTQPHIQRITMRDLSIEEQILVALESAVFVTVCGGGAVTATFLPPGSSLIVFYPEDGGFDFWKYNYTYTPARLDWDLLTNAPHLRVHWMPMKSMESADDLQALQKLILHEWNIISRSMRRS